MAVTVVAVEDIGAVVGYVEVCVVVVVVVGDGDAHAPARIADAGGLGALLEGAVADIAVERVARWRDRVGVCREARAVNQVDIEPAIAVVVEEGSAAAFGFDDIVLYSPPRTHAEIYTGGCGHIGKEHGRKVCDFLGSVGGGGLGCTGGRSQQERATVMEGAHGASTQRKPI
jgi:hypothetical protein